jgi:hypothetical protein
LVILGVNAWDEEREVIEEFVRDQNIKHKILLNGEDVRHQYGVFAVPTNLWINPQGMVVDAAIGFDNEEDLEDRIKNLLSPAS